MIIDRSSVTSSVKKLVFVITQHDVLGALPAPFAINVLKSGDFSLAATRLYPNTVGDYFDDLPKEIINAVELIDGCTDDNLMKRFSKNTRSVDRFWDEMTESRLKSVVRPWVDKQVCKLLQILMDLEMPLYYKGRKKDPVNPVPIPVNKSEAGAVFTFEKMASGSRYSISVICNGEEVSLKSDISAVLVNDPGWIVAGGTVCRLEKGIDGSKVLPFFRKDYIDIPASAEEKYFGSFVVSAIKQFKVRLIGIEMAVLKPECRPHLSIDHDLKGNPLINLSFNYGGKKCNFGDRNKCWVELIKEDEGFSFNKLVRYADRENYYIQFLESMGLESNDQVLFTIPEDSWKINSGPIDNLNSRLYNIVEWIADKSDILCGAGFIIKPDFGKVNYFTGGIKLEMDVGHSNDWFDVKAFAVFGDHRIPFTALRRHLLSGIREFKLPDGRIVVLPTEWFAKYKQLFMHGKTRDNSLRFGKHHYRVATSVSGVESLPESIRLLEDAGSIELPDVPGNLTGVLRPYQLKGYAWLQALHKNSLGGCLADDMGLGKTLQTLTHLLKVHRDPSNYINSDEQISKGSPVKQLRLFDTERSGRQTTPVSMIVMPLSLIHNWENEIVRFAPDLRYAKYTGSARELLRSSLTGYDIVLTTYGVVRNDLEFLCKIKFCYIVLDESQIIKNADSKIYKSVMKLDSCHRLVLTGTPIENSLSDLWSQMNFINPGILGSLNFFRSEFIDPVQKENDDSIKENLKNIIEPFILRRTKGLVEKDLPDLSEKVYYCEMDDDQAKLYEEKKSAIRNAVLERLSSGSGKSVRIDVLRGLMELRLIANHPVLASHKGIGSGKFNEVVRNIESVVAEGHKLLIFSQFVKHLNLFREWFEGNKLKYSMLTGQQKGSERERVISGFQSDQDNSLFLISLRAGGVGLNLTSADYVFILDPWWNPAVEQQAISRAHRIGQKRNVFSYKFIAKESVEEKILQLQQRKAELAGDFISINDPLKSLTDNDLIELFG